MNEIVIDYVTMTNDRESNCITHLRRDVFDGMKNFRVSGLKSDVEVSDVVRCSGNAVAEVFVLRCRREIEGPGRRGSKMFFVFAA